MDIAIIGAGGTIGRQIAIALVQERVLPPTSRLQLIGHAGGESARTLHGFAADLADAYAEVLPEIDVAFSPDELLADIVIVAAGATVGTDPRRIQARAELARINLPLMQSYAEALARHGHGEELVLVVTNPVELGVHVFARSHPRARVIGMGAYLDTLRFRREIAAELGVRRQGVQGLVLGEHGPGMVPCWSTVSAYGFDSEEGRARLASLRRRGGPTPEQSARAVVDTLLSDGPAAAYRLVAGYGADVRTMAKPYVTQLSGAKTPVGSAEMIARLVETIVDGHQALAAAQVVLDGEFLGIRGITGAPVVLSHRGIERVEPLALWDDEATRVRAAAAQCARSVLELGA